MAEEFRLRVAVVEYIKDLSSNSSSGLDSDSLEVALQCLAESLQIDIDSDTYEKNKLNPKTLLSVFKAGLNGGSADSSDAAAAPTSSDAAAGTADHWNAYVSSMVSMGLFSGLAIGTTDYNNVLKGLATQYQTKYSLSESPMGSDAISPMDKQRAEILKADGNTMLQKGDTKAAHAKYSQAILLDPSNHLYWANRAVAQYKLGKFAESAADCKQAVAIEPKYVKAHYRLGQSYAAQRSYTEAVEAYTKAIEVAKQVGDNSIRGEIQRELDNVKAKSKPVVSKKNKNNGGAAGANGGLNLGALMGNPEVQAMLSNPNLMESLGSMLGGGQDGNVDLSALQGMLGGAGGADGPSADNLADIVQQVQGDPSVEALNDDEQMAAIMAEIERDGPMSAMKYLQDPTVMAKIGPLVQKFMSGMKK